MDYRMGSTGAFGLFHIGVGWLTGLNAGLIYGAVGLPALLLFRQQKTAVAFVVVGAVAAAPSFLGDFTLGELVDRVSHLGQKGLVVTQAVTSLAEQCFLGSWHCCHATTASSRNSRRRWSSFWNCWL